MKMHWLTKKTATWVLGAVVGMGITIGVNTASAETPAKKAPASQPASPKTAQEALQAAQKSGAFLMVIFFDKKDDAVKTMEQAVATFKGKSAEKIHVFEANVKDPAEAPMVKKYGVGHAKLPLLLVFAPNGAVTGGFEQKVTDEKLAKSLVSELVAKIIKAVRERKVVVVELQNAKTRYNAEADKVAKELADDTRLKGSVEIFKGDPDNPKNLQFLGQCEIKRPVGNATLVLLAPPQGTIMGSFSGDKVTKAALLDALTPKNSGCCPGGSGSCK